MLPVVAVVGRETNLGGEINELEGGGGLRDRLSRQTPPKTPTNFARALQAD